jgi:hypothetical protein
MITAILILQAICLIMVWFDGIRLKALESKVSEQRLVIIRLNAEVDELKTELDSVDISKGR